MLKKKMPFFLIGIIAGSILTVSTGALAQSSKLVSAYLANHVKFEFNGELKSPPSDKPAINYDDSIYVPIRFISDASNMNINWNGQTQTIEVKTQEPEVIEKIVYVEVPKEEDKETDKENDAEDKEESKKEKDNQNYKTLPITKTYNDMEITAKLVVANESETKVYFSVENDSYTPIQLKQKDTIIEVDGEPYNIQDKSAEWDFDWYDDIRKDEEKEGYIIFNEIPEDAKGIYVVLKIIQNDGSGKYTEVPFEIKVD